MSNELVSNKVGHKNRLKRPVKAVKFRHGGITMAEELPRIPIPGPDANPAEKMVFLQEQMFNFFEYI